MNKKNLITTMFIIFLVGMTAAIVYAVEIGDENCTEDIYECTEWSACSTDGTQSRSCELISVCSNADNDVPLELMDCEYQSTLGQSLECKYQGTLRQRVECRLNLESDPPPGLNIAFMPEECTASFDAEGKDACIMKYSDVQNCWKSNSAQTDTCLRQHFNLNNVAQRKSQCNNDASCLYELKSDVNDLAKLRIHELEFRAETMLSKGLIGMDDAVDIISYLEQQKLAFQNSPSSDDGVRILSSVKNNWRNFIDRLEE